MAENKKEKIIKAAIELFSKNGVDGTSTRDISKLADANISMISYYFGGKEGLFEAIIQDLFQKQEVYIRRVYNPKEYNAYSKEQKAEAFINFLLQIVTFFYSEISNTLLTFLLREQSRIQNICQPPVIVLLRKMLADILEKDENSREIVLKTVFIASQINSPRIAEIFITPYLPKGIRKEEIEIIKDNVKKYALMIFRDEGINI